MENSGPLVSVVVIFLDAEEFIQETIESVVAQTYDEWELLLVDDGSTDGSTRTALKYARQLPGKVRYIEHDGHQNRGMSASRNRGIEAAQGEFVALIDADDIWLPQHLEVYVSLLNSHPEAAMVYGNTEYWFSWTGSEEDQAQDFIPTLGVETGSLIRPPMSYSLYLSGKAAVPCLHSILVRREVFRRRGGFVDAFTGAYEDQAFFAKIFLNEHVIATDACLDRYRQHPGSCTAGSRNRRTKAEERVYFLNWLEKYLLQEDINEPAVWRALRVSQWRLQHPALARVQRGIRRLLGAPGG